MGQDRGGFSVPGFESAADFQGNQNFLTAIGKTNLDAELGLNELATTQRAAAARDLGALDLQRLQTLTGIGSERLGRDEGLFDRGEGARQFNVGATERVRDRETGVREGAADRSLTNRKFGGDFSLAKSQAIDQFNALRAQGMDAFTAAQAAGLDAFDLSRADFAESEANRNQDDRQFLANLGLQGSLGFEGLRNQRLGTQAQLF